MELLQLKYFCDAAQTQNFSKTAKKYLVPTSNISQSIKRLEKELDCELFEHRANKILLNDEGRRFFVGASQALELLDNAKSSILDRTGLVQGEIKIICLCNRRIVTRAIEKFINTYPQVNFVLNHNFQAEQDFDVIISDICPCKYGKKILFVDEEILIAVSRKHPLALKNGFSLGDLENERFITMTERGSLYKITVNTCAEAGFTPNIAIQTDDPFYVRKYIELGLGIAFVPSVSWQGLLGENVILKNVGNLRRKTYAYLPKNKRTKNSVEKFLDILKEETAVN